MSRPTIKSKDIKIDPVSMRVWRYNSEVKLSISEFNILLALVSEPVREFSREELAELVKKRGGTRDIRAIDVYIARIRRKCRRKNSPDVIATLNRRGYRFS